MRLWAVRPSAHHLKAAADGAVWIAGIKLHVVRQSRDGGSTAGAGLAGSAGPRTVPSAVTVIRVAEAPFAVATLPPGEDLVLRIFVDRYLVEVFANDRQAMVATFPDHADRRALHAFSIGEPTTIKKIEIWKIEPTSAGFLAAQADRVWEPQTE